MIKKGKEGTVNLSLKRMLSIVDALKWRQTQNTFGRPMGTQSHISQMEKLEHKES
jgi:hypothetical protein